MSRTAPTAGGLPEIVGVAAAGNRAADQRDGGGNGTVGFRQIQDAAARGQPLPQPGGECRSVRTGRFLKVQQNPLEVPAAALPQHRRTQGLRVSDLRGLPVTDGQQSASGLQ